jgi:hypothetical protein
MPLGAEPAAANDLAERLQNDMLVEELMQA